jgi:acyl-CoA reductase-like NAD-dependent aldehyde dehydrogenase
MSVKKYELMFDGCLVSGVRHLEVLNPADETVIGLAPIATPEQLDAAVAAARRAFRSWRDTPLDERRALVVRMAEVIEQHIDELSSLLTAEQGKPKAVAMLDVGGGAHFCRAFSSLDMPVEVHEDSDQRSSKTFHVPVGVVAAIAPWNVPISLAFWKVAPALIAGNTVVLKPSPFTPLTTLRIAEVVRSILPPGVFSVLSGDDQLGPWITGHAGFDKVSFTGSTATGRRVMQSASATLKRLTLELGGNDAAIVLPGVDVAVAAPKVFSAAFANSGQICAAAKRVYVHEDIYDAFADAIVALGRAARVGNGAEPGVDFGPIQNHQQFERVNSLLEDCRSNNQRFLLGGERPESQRGYFVPLTVIDNPPAESRIVREEQFGPVMPLIKYSDFDEVVNAANDSEFGLAASIWGPEDLAAEIAPRLEVGTVWINEAYVISPNQPFGGRKQSGFGVENGMPGLLEYTTPLTIVSTPHVPAA